MGIALGRRCENERTNVFEIAISLQACPYSPRMRPTVKNWLLCAPISQLVEDMYRRIQTRKVVTSNLR